MMVSIVFDGIFKGIISASNLRYRKGIYYIRVRIPAIMTLVGMIKGAANTKRIEA